MPPTSPPATHRPFIEVRGLKKSFGNQEVLRGITIDIMEGETLSIIGSSGGGKSVFMKHLLGLIQPDAGSIVIEGNDVSRLSERQLGPIRRKIGILFQNGALFDSMTVAQNVAFPLWEEGIRDEKTIESRVGDALDVVGLSEHMDKMPISLSGGMRKRVALARAIINRPRCILYDEPTSGLDPVVSDTIEHLIQRLRDRFRVTSVVVTHDMHSVNTISNRVAFFRNGKVYFLGTTDELLASRDGIIRDFINGRSHELEPGGAASAGAAIANTNEIL